MVTLTRRRVRTGSRTGDQSGSNTFESQTRPNDDSDPCDAHGVKSQKPSSWLPIATALGAFVIALIVVRHFRPSGFLLEQSVLLGALIATLQFIIGWRKHAIPMTTLVKDVALAFLLTYTVVFTFPTQADRSFSLMMLQRLALAPSGMSRQEISQFYKQEFVEHGGLDRRLLEQMASGTLIEREGKFTLTRKGLIVVRGTELTCHIFQCQVQPVNQVFPDH